MSREKGERETEIEKEQKDLGTVHSSPLWSLRTK